MSTDTHTLLLLLNWMSPAFPVGSFAYSHALEWAIADDIYQGALSRYLLYPANYGILKYATHVGALLPTLVQVGEVFDPPASVPPWQ